MLQLRAKDCPASDAARCARDLRSLTRKFGALFIVNDDVDLAIGSGADGVHLGQSDEPVREARRRTGDGFVIGATCCGSLDLARKAVANGADYVSFGALFASGTKPDAEPCDHGVFARFRKEAPGVPLAGIGGINAGNAQKAAATGADILAACEGIFGVEDVAAAAGKLKETLDGKQTLS